jgi:hypothetical protein
MSIEGVCFKETPEQARQRFRQLNPREAEQVAALDLAAKINGDVVDHDLNIVIAKMETARRREAETFRIGF